MFIVLNTRPATDLVLRYEARVNALRASSSYSNILKIPEILASLFLKVYSYEKRVCVYRCSDVNVG